MELDSMITSGKYYFFHLIIFKCEINYCFFNFRVNTRLASLIDYYNKGRMFRQYTLENYLKNTFFNDF